MATIKVTYNSISRRFNITSINWVELEYKLRSLYNIPSTSTLTVSYKDEDGDIITLSSDLELEEVLAQQSSGIPIKLVLNTVDNKSENLVFEDGNYNVSTELEEKNVESRPPLNYQHVTFNDEEEEPEYGQSTPLLNKEKEKESERQRSERTNENEAQPGQNEEKDDDDDDEFIYIFPYPWTYQTFFGPRFGFGGPRFGFGGPRFGFGGPRFGLFNGPRHCPFNPHNFYEHRPAFFNGYSGPSHCFGSRQCGPNTCNGNSESSYCSKPQQSYFCNKNAEASTSASAKTNGCNKSRYNHSSRPFCGRNSNFFHPQYYNQTTLTQEQLNDKLSTLYSMGFDSSNNALYEDLLKRYNGNLDRVVELLLRNQQVNEYYDNEKASTSKSKKQNGIVINEEKPNNDGIKQVDNEESKPYNL